MEFIADTLYHIYNRGNDKHQIFFNDDNSLYFLGKTRKCISPVCDIINFTLMPNHFHFLIHANTRTADFIEKKGVIKNELSEGIKYLLSSYAKAINKRQGTVGNLFQQNTNSKCLTLIKHNYSTTCFHYIYQNAWKAGLVNRMEDWRYSSFRDFIGMRKGTICNEALAFELLDLDEKRLYEDSYGVIDTDKLKFLL